MERKALTDEEIKEQRREKARLYYQANKDRILEQMRVRYANGSRQDQKGYYTQNRNEIRAKQNQRYQDKHDQYLNIMRTYQANNKEKCYKASMAWLKKNPEKHRIYAARYYEKNKEKINKQIATRRKVKKAATGLPVAPTDPIPDAVV